MKGIRVVQQMVAAPTISLGQSQIFKHLSQFPKAHTLIQAWFANKRARIWGMMGSIFTSLPHIQDFFF